MADIRWNQVNANFNDANSAMSNSIAGLRSTGDIFSKAAELLFQEQQRAADNVYKEKLFGENQRQFNAQQALARDLQGLQEAELEEKKRSNLADEALRAKQIAASQASANLLARQYADSQQRLLQDEEFNKTYKSYLNFIATNNLSNVPSNELSNNSVYKAFYDSLTPYQRNVVDNTNKALRTHPSDGTNVSLEQNYNEAKLMTLGSLGSGNVYSLAAEQERTLAQNTAAKNLQTRQELSSGLNTFLSGLQGNEDLSSEEKNIAGLIGTHLYNNGLNPSQASSIMPQLIKVLKEGQSLDNLFNADGTFNLTSNTRELISLLQPIYSKTNTVANRDDVSSNWNGTPPSQDLDAFLRQQKSFDPRYNSRGQTLDQARESANITAQTVKDNLDKLDAMVKAGNTKQAQDLMQNDPFITKMVSNNISDFNEYKRENNLNPVNASDNLEAMIKFLRERVEREAMEEAGVPNLFLRNMMLQTGGLR